MPISDYVLRGFLSAGHTGRRRVVDAVRTAGFSIENIQEDYSTPEKWGLILKPNRRLRDLFWLDREVLLWCSTYPVFQARDIEDMKRVIDEMGVRLTRSFAILVTAYDPRTRSRLEAESSLDITIVHCSLEEIAAVRDETGTPVLQKVLLARLYTRDLYELPSATTRAADFFGRRRSVDSIADELITGGNQIGVFGLRKIGKTSLTNRVTDAVTQSGRCIVAKVDLQWTTAIDPRPEYTLWAIGEAIFAASRAIRRLQGLRLFGKYTVLSEAMAASNSLWEDFAHDLVMVLGKINRRLVLAVDEFERLFELSNAAEPLRFWRVLRGLDQQHPERLRLLVSGTSPEYVERSTVNGIDNPLFRYLSVRYLGPLDPDDARELLVELGSPMGLKWDGDAVSYAIQQTGGHPALLRTLGSVVHSLLQPREVRMEVSREVVVSASERILAAHSAVLAQVTASLEDKYADEFVMLKMLAEGQVSAFRQLADSYPDEMSHLIAYGLLPDGARSERLSIGLLQSYLQRRTSRQPHARLLSSSLVQMGERIGSWTIQSKLNEGGYAEVFLAENGDGRRVAVKVFKSALLSALEREVGYLKVLSHAGVVHFIETSRSESGHPCLVMEYLAGRPLSEVCNATAAPVTRDTMEIAARLLEALEYMHPDQKAADELASRSQLNSTEFEEWGRKRHGIVHRDIKPENVILTADRGPVLIDFGIAVRAAEPVVTMSATQGYLPPDFNGVSWTADVDMFQLGVTLAQVSSGARYDGTNLDDLLLLAETRHGTAFGHLIRDMCRAAPRPTASEAASRLHDLRSLQY
jgi:serine/threonine-protein kinase